MNGTEFFKDLIKQEWTGPIIQQIESLTKTPFTYEVTPKTITLFSTYLCSEIYEILCAHEGASLPQTDPIGIFWQWYYMWLPTSCKTLSHRRADLLRAMQEIVDYIVKECEDLQLPLNLYLEAVHLANLTKKNPQTKNFVLNSNYRVVKPITFQEPDFKKIKTLEKNTSNLISPFMNIKESTPANLFTYNPKKRCFRIFQILMDLLTAWSIDTYAFIVEYTKDEQRFSKLKDQERDTAVADGLADIIYFLGDIANRCSFGIQYFTRSDGHVIYSFFDEFVVGLNF